MSGGDQRFPEGGKRDEDLRDNPGIGQSKGTSAVTRDVQADEGENTVEGDVDNAAGPHGEASQRTGRTNK